MTGKPYSSVREMARKFEGLAKEVSNTTPTTTTISNTKEERRKLAYQKRPSKPVKPLPDRASGSSSTSSTIKTDEEEDVDDDDDDDDLLFDKLITDINIVVNDTSSSTMPFENYYNEDYSNMENIYEEVLYDTVATDLPPGQRVVEELLERERSYVRNLTKGIMNYMMAPDDPDRPSQADRAHIFGNIIVIRNFHQNTFLPSLESSASDIEKMCNCICNYIEQGYLYSYIEYAINRKRAKMLYDQNQVYFRRRAAEVDDPLGIEAAFLLQPIQRLPRYQLLLYQLIQQLGARLSNDEHDNVKAKIAACCLAEKHIQRLLDRMNESMTISDIVEFQTHLEFLIRNIADHGEFQMVADFLINDLSRRRRYLGKLFLFDKCVVYTETESPRMLRFRGFYQQSSIGMAFNGKRIGFRLYHLRPGIEEIECDVPTVTDGGGSGDGMAVFRRWSEAIGNMMLRSVGTITWNPSEKQS